MKDDAQWRCNSYLLFRLCDFCKDESDQRLQGVQYYIVNRITNTESQSRSVCHVGSFLFVLHYSHRSGSLDSMLLSCHGHVRSLVHPTEVGARPKRLARCVFLEPAVGEAEACTRDIE